MRPGLQQSTGLRQELKVNPRLYQAMDLLYMPLLDLQQHLKQELLTNPFLDLVEPEDEEDESADEDEVPEAQDLAEPETTVEPEPEKAGDDDVDWEAVLLDGFETGGQREEHEQREYYEPVTVDTRDLSDHLTEQLSLLDLTPRQVFLAEEFVGNINDDGYLACPLDEIQRGVNELLVREAEEREIETAVPAFSDAEMAAMLQIIQDLDPPGVGARDLRECLLLQLRAAGQRESLAWRLVEEAFEELIAHRWSELSKRFGISAQTVQAAHDDIAKLDPKPGLRFSAGSDNYIIPDLVVEKIDGQYHIFLNDGNLPRLKLSRAYQEIARDKKRFDTESKDFIAKILVYSLSNRQYSLSNAFIRASGQELARFSQGMATLDTCITAAPLLGLLGTVTGMMRTFGALGGGDIGAAAGAITGGVAEALIATAFGLLLAIIGLFPYNYLNARAEQAKQDVADVSHALEILLKKGETTVPFSG